MSTTETDNQDTESLLTRVPPDIKKRVRVAAAMEDKSISEYLRDLVEDEVPEINA